MPRSIKMCHITDTFVIGGRYQVCSCGRHLWSTVSRQGLTLGPHTALTSARFSASDIDWAVRDAQRSRAGARALTVALVLIMACLSLIFAARVSPELSQWTRCQTIGALDTAEGWIESLRSSLRPRDEL